jgi:glutathione synthase/RimK-type ligase-like ATP-grasp enzyme
MGLDFGAVDIGHRLIDNQFFVFEVNTAPGLEGTTLDKYAKAIYNYYRSLI